MCVPDDELTIIIPTHDSYIDVFVIFMQLFKKYWRDCPYKLVLSCNEYVPECEKFTDIEIVNNPEDCLITNRIYNAALRYPSRYYLVLLEDMFFSKTVDTGKFQSLLANLKKDNVHYCRLMPSKEKKQWHLDYPSKTQAYAICLMGFICDMHFIEEHFKENMTGWDYEERQLEKTLQHTKKERYDSEVICSGNPLNLIHGISKGKWERHAYKRIKKLNPEIDLNGRERLSLGATIKTKLFSFSHVLSPKQRIRMKKFLSKLGFKFTTKY